MIQLAMSSRLLRYLGLIILICALFLVFGYTSLQNFLKVDYPLIPTSSPVSSSSPVGGIEFTYNDKIYNYQYFYVEDLSKLRLIPNFTQELTSAEIIKQNNCQMAANGGFYTTDQKPVGLFVASGEQLGKVKQSSLFDVNLVNNGKNLYFENSSSFLTPQDHIFAIQIGPRLVQNSQTQKLNIKNDKYARRIVIAKTDTNKVVFIVLFDPSSVYKGPQLQDLPSILQLIKLGQNIALSDAVNLDGGSASVFFTPEIDLNELSLVGSIFCVTP